MSRGQAESWRQNGGTNLLAGPFTPVTWQEFLDAGGKISGFRESRWTTLQKVKAGDYFLGYGTGISRWIGILEVTSEPFRDTTQIWKDEGFPCRVKVKVVAKLTPETGVPVKDMKDQLSVFQRPMARYSGTPSNRGIQLVGLPTLSAFRESIVRPLRRQTFGRQPCQ